MKLKNPLLVVRNITVSQQFYHEVLGLHTVADLNGNVVLTGGLSLQAEDIWLRFINQPVSYQGNDAEIYFEEDDFDVFLQHLNEIQTIEYVHPVKEHSWGQRAVRFYDPDHHIIEVAENMKTVCKRYLNQGMTLEQIAKKMDVPLKAVRFYTR